MSIEGGCICGAVRYRIDEKDPPVLACCCTDCQTRSGGAFGMTMPVWRSKFSCDGDTVTGRRTLPTSVEAIVYSCAKCLTELYSQNQRLPDIYTVRAGTLDDSVALKPAAIMWTQSKQGWISLSDSIRQFETQPDDPAIWMEILEMGRRPQ